MQVDQSPGTYFWHDHSFAFKGGTCRGGKHMGGAEACGGAWTCLISADPLTHSHERRWPLGSSDHQTRGWIPRALPVQRRAPDRRLRCLAHGGQRAGYDAQQARGCRPVGRRWIDCGACFEPEALFLKPGPTGSEYTLGCHLPAGHFMAVRTAPVHGTGWATLRPSSSMTGAASTIVRYL